MAKYTYRGYRESGQPINGNVQGPSKELAVATLREQGITPTEIREIRDNFLRRDINLGALQRVKRQTLITFTRRLATMLRSGNPPLQCLIALEEQPDAHLTRAIRDMGQDLERGMDLSDAMQKHGDIFDENYVEMVRAGETSGKLAEVLTRIVVELKRKQRLRRKIVKAMSYPTIVLSVAFVLVILIATLLVPRFTSVYAELGGQLPAATRAIVKFSEFVAPPDGGIIPVKPLIWLMVLLGTTALGYVLAWRAVVPKLLASALTFIIILVATVALARLDIVGSIGHTSQTAATFLRFGFFALFVAAIIQSFRYTIATPGGRDLWDRIKFKIPFIGDMILQVTLARYSSTLSALYASGIDFPDALESAGRSAGNVVIEKASNNIRLRIIRGGGIAESFKAEGVFPPMMVQMIATGEDEGELPDQLQAVSEEYEENVDAAIERLDGIVEPIMLLLVGLIVGGMIIAMYLPLLNLPKFLGQGYA